jgi:hypothetical protein
MCNFFLLKRTNFLNLVLFYQERAQMIKPSHIARTGLSERFISKQRQNDRFEIM